MSLLAFVRRTQRYYIPLILIVLIAEIFTSNLQDARWTRQSVQYGLIIALAIVLGAASAVSRFRARTVLVYHGLMSIALAAESVSHFFPSRSLLNAATQISVFRLMNIRMINFGERIRGWVQSVFQRQPIYDDGWLLFCIVLLIWSGFTWFMWCLLRRQRTMDGLIPLGLMLGINIHLRSEATTPLLTFIAIACALVLYMLFYRTQASWLKREIDHPDLRYDWSINSILLILIVTVSTIVFPLLSTERGWETIADFIESIQIEPRTAPSGPSGGTPIYGGSGQVSVDTPDISTIGTPLDRGRETVMLVSINDPPPPPLEAGLQTRYTPKHYWRSEVYGEYTGSGWLPIETRLAIETWTDEAAETPQGRYFLQQNFEILAPHGDRLFAVNRPVSADATIQFASIGQEDFLISGQVAKYSVSSYAEKLTAYDLSTTPTDYPDEIVATYLQLPESIPSRVRNLANRISLGTETPYEVVKRIEFFLRDNYTYDPDVPPTPVGEDAVDYFLFEAQGGFCSHYASAMVIMLRSQGIPARIVTGFAMGEYDYRESAYRVRVDDSHAWVEVYFSGYGWIGFEPTSSRTIFVRSPQEFRSEIEPESGDSPATTLVLPRNLVLNGLRVLLCVLAVGSVVLLYKRMDFSRKTPREKVQSLYMNMRRFLKTSGYMAPTSTTPNEFLYRFTATLSEQAYVHEALTQCTALYLKARFSDLDISEKAADQTRVLWRRARKQRLSLGLKYVWRKSVSRHVTRLSGKDW